MKRVQSLESNTLVLQGIHFSKLTSEKSVVRCTETQISSLLNRKTRSLSGAAPIEQVLQAPSHIGKGSPRLQGSYGQVNYVDR
jgi:hypothetical protein